jgi:hypothetical protein
VYYQAATKGGTISATVNDGQIAPNVALTVGTSQYLLGAAAGAQVDLAISNPSTVGLTTAQKHLRQAVITNEILAEALKPSVASLDGPQNTQAL